MNKTYSYNGLLFESVVKLEKHKRDVKAAIQDAQSSAIQGFDPGYPIVLAHKNAKKAALNSVKSEFKKQKDAKVENITVGTNFIKNDKYVEPKEGYLIVSVHIYMPQKKGFFKRFLSGSIGNWFQDVGVVALKNYIKEFAGDDFAKEVSKETASNAIGEGENAGKTSYYMALKIPRD